VEGSLVTDKLPGGHGDYSACESGRGLPALQDAVATATPLSLSHQLSISFAPFSKRSDADSPYFSGLYIASMRAGGAMTAPRPVTRAR